MRTKALLGRYQWLASRRSNDTMIYMRRLLAGHCVWIAALAIPIHVYGANNGATPEETEPVNILAEAKFTSEDGAKPKLPDFSDSKRRPERERMVSQQIAAYDVSDPSVLAALRNVPRHRLVPDQLAAYAYDDRPLPIGHGQTISQPYIVALMTQLLDLDPQDNVLEVGTGSGYQAAILGLLTRNVVSIEIIEPLARRAAEDLAELGYENLTLLHGDGYFGYEEQAPYDAIIVTAAAEHIPPPLIAQLKPEGKMIIPVGRKGWTQNLILVRKNAKGRVSTQNLLPVRFVPLTRKVK